ncbi:MAG: hypothetical protein M4579_004464 [Chaenotheca gracillima]|nr:MAG: hypothetical protein M4579_004464 [Chaenotheca gracillima]
MRFALHGIRWEPSALRFQKRGPQPSTTFEHRRSAEALRHFWKSADGLYNQLHGRAQIGPGPCLLQRLGRSETPARRAHPRNWPTRTGSRRICSKHGLKERARLGTAAGSFEGRTKAGQEPAEVIDEFRPWVDILQRFHHNEGIEGIRRFWDEVRHRNIFLPASGTSADQLWEGLLILGFKDEAVLDDIRDYSLSMIQDGSIPWTKLQTTMVAHYLSVNSMRTLEWANLGTEVDVSLLSNEALLHLAPMALKNDVSMIQFREIYERSECRGLYDTVMRCLCSDSRFDEAYSWHRLMVSRKDLPSDFSVVEPMMKALAPRTGHKQLQKLTTDLLDAGVPFKKPGGTTALGPVNSALSREVMNRVLGHTFSILPLALSDNFCARLFATSAFSVDAIFSGLHMLGVESIGPCAMRELAERSETPASLGQRLSQLREAGISTGSSRFSQLFRQCVTDDDQELFEDLLATDQHPDAFEDRPLQETLLASYLETEDWRQFNRTIRVLTAASSVPSIETWNLLFRSQLMRQDLAGATSTMNQMHHASVPITMKSSHCIWNSLLRRKRRAGSWKMVKFQRQSHVKKAQEFFQKALEHGGVVPPKAWPEILCQLSRRGKVDELGALCDWLMSVYSRKPAATSYNKAALPRVTSVFRLNGQAQAEGSRQSLNPLRTIFNPIVQRAVACTDLSFDSVRANRLPGTDHENRDSRQKPWPRGVALLRQLQQQGVHIHPGTISKGLRDRMQEMAQTSMRKNRQLPPDHIQYLRNVAKEAERCWGASLFTGDHALQILNVRRVDTHDR